MSEPTFGEDVRAAAERIWPWMKNRSFSAKVARKRLKHGRTRLQMTLLVDPAAPADANPEAHRE